MAVQSVADIGLPLRFLGLDDLAAPMSWRGSPSCPELATPLWRLGGARANRSAKESARWEGLFTTSATARVAFGTLLRLVVLGTRRWGR